jgi:probable F420-dependent oxidoreductase
VERLFGGNVSGIVEFAQLAESKGIDQVSAVDHVVMGGATAHYPYGPFPVDVTAPWYEPLTLLAAIATATKTIRLATGILITPLRSAVLLAKQVATLDHLSGGRVDLGVGVGWQKAEYDAAGIPWDGRFGRMIEQIEACKALWGQAPASYAGDTTNFAEVYSLPFPVQKPGIPIWFGIAATDRNIARIAQHGDGWLPMDDDSATLADAIRRIKAAFAARGRDPSTLMVRHTLKSRLGKNGLPDIDATLAQVPDLVAAGVTVISLQPTAFCRSARDAEALFAKLAACKAGFG